MNDYVSVKEYFSEFRYHSELAKDAKVHWDEPVKPGIKEKDVEPILDKIHHKLHAQQNNQINLSMRFYHSFSKIAALLLLPGLITIAILAHILTDNVDNVASWAEIHSPAGARTHFTLPDGSEGWLNSTSSIKYNINFQNNRKVELSGEAWFNVKHNKGNRFVVGVNGFDINVLGTKFNVLSYDDGNTAEVILEEGKVLVESKNSTLSKKLEIDQQFIYNKSNNTFVVNKVDAEAYTAWKDGVLVFKGQPMSVLAERIGRRYNAEIKLHGEDLKELVLRAKFEDESLEEILKLISITEPITYKIHQRNKLPDDTYSKTKVEIWLIN